jgi:hypothetical protein
MTPRRRDQRLERHDLAVEPLLVAAATVRLGPTPSAG